MVENIYITKQTTHVSSQGGAAEYNFLVFNNFLIIQIFLQVISFWKVTLSI